MEARIAGQTNLEPVAVNVRPDVATVMNTIDGVPLDLFYYFNLDTRDADEHTKKQLNDIYGKLNPQNMTDLLAKVRVIENRLGAPQLGETRYSKVWNYVRIQDQINKLQAQQAML